MDARTTYSERLQMTRYRTRPREVEAVQRCPECGDTSPLPECYTCGGYPSRIVTDATGHRIVKAGDFAEQFEEIKDE